MFKQRGIVAFVATMALALIVALPAAAQLPEGWRARDIGEPPTPGSTKYENGVFTVTGYGVNLWATDNDHFQFVSREVTGDGTIIARIVSSTGNSDQGWQKNGAMIRENDTQGSPHATTYMTNRGVGLHFLWREEQDGETREIPGFAPRVFPIWVRTQRVGNEFSGFFSWDGQIWQHTSTQNVSMGERANFGLHVMPHHPEVGDTVVFDNVSVVPGLAAVTRVSACGSDAGVLLQWAPLKGAQSYNVYRGPEAIDIRSVKLEQLQRINADAVPQASFTDNSEGLKPGALYVYAVTAVRDGVEGSPIAVLAGKPGPSSPPPGFTYSVIGQHREGECALGSVGVAMDETGVITMRSGGHDIWGDNDAFTFLHQKVTGNFRITVSMLQLPTGTDYWAKVGPMIREDLSAGSRHGIFALTPGNGLVFQHRPQANGESESGDAALQWDEARDAVATGGPLFLRLTRQGDTITPEYSRDGTNFEPGGDPITLSGLKAEVEVGVAHTSHNTSRISTARFRDIKIEKL